MSELMEDEKWPKVLKNIIMDDSSIIGYDTVLSDVIDLLESARRTSARTIIRFHDSDILGNREANC